MPLYLNHSAWRPPAKVNLDKISGHSGDSVGCAGKLSALAIIRNDCLNWKR